jgi:hypothetical protein
LLGLSPEAIAIDAHGVSLTPRQALALIALARAGKAAS